MASDSYAVARGYWNNEWIPGKFHITGLRGYVSWDAKEHEVKEIELLLHGEGATVEWVELANGNIPTHPIGPMGADGLFIGRALCPSPENKYTPGKIHPKWK